MKKQFRPGKRKRKKTHGFLKKMSNPGGKRVLKRRRSKKRSNLTPTISKNK